MEEKESNVGKIVGIEFAILVIAFFMILIMPILILFLVYVFPVIPIIFSLVFLGILAEKKWADKSALSALVFNLGLAALLVWICWFGEPISGSAFFSNT